MTGRGWPLWLLTAGLLLAACQKVPKDRYGIQKVTVVGAEQMDEDALKNCLLTEERRHFSLTLGVSEAGKCGEPPFDEGRKHLNFWYWPWTVWPLYDALALSKDMDRVERWYEARGFHQAQAISYEVSPEQAREEDTLPAQGDPGCKRRKRGQGCTIEVEIKVSEGEPTIVVELVIDGEKALGPKVQKALREAVVLEQGERFDEAFYDETREGLGDALARFGYAKARVRGEARVDRGKREAKVRFELDPGPKCVFGEVEVLGAEDYMVEPIRGITLVRPGDPFSTEAVQDARQAVFGTHLFTSVVIEPVTHEENNIVDLKVEVKDLSRNRFGLGAGAQSGVVQRGDGWGESISVPQWDVHLIGRYTRNRVFDGPRRFSIVDRPAMITQEAFPGFDRPRFGNSITMTLGQAGVFEPRIDMLTDATYVYGPDYYDTFFRNRVDTGVVWSRFFFLRRTLNLGFGLRGSVYRVNQCVPGPDGTTMPPPGRKNCELTEDGDIPPADYQLAYFVERIRVDLRDNEAKPHKGAMFLMEAQQSLLFKWSSWSYVRLTPDARVYIPLPARMTLAARFAVGMYFIRQASAALDPLSQQLGPRDLRLRGGGASSNRGFLAGQLGDGDEGGIRRWESSLEWRITVTPNIGLTGFVDAGDVSRTAPFRFNYPQMAAGFGFRIFTPVGPLRLDVGWQLPGLQVFGPDERTGDAEQHNFPRGRPGAFHFSIGEAF